MPRVIYLFTSLSFLAWMPVCAQDAQPNATLGANPYDFGTVIRGAQVEMSVGITNHGDKPLKIARVVPSLSDMKTRTPRSIAPGQTMNMYLELDTASYLDDVQGNVAIQFEGQPPKSLELDIRGRVKSSVEVQPAPPVFLQAFRWNADKAQRVLTVKARNQEPLKSLRLESKGDQFLTSLSALKEGEGYQLRVKLNPEGPAKRAVGSITLISDHERIKFPVFTFIRDKVYTYPAEVQFPPFDLEEIQKNPDKLNFLKQSLFVYQFSGTEFQIEIKSMPGYISVEKSPASGAGAVIDIPNQGSTAVFELIFSPNPASLKKGSFRDTIKITTNDPEFPELNVPVQFQVR